MRYLRMAPLVGALLVVSACGHGGHGGGGGGGSSSSDSNADNTNNTSENSSNSPTQTCTWESSRWDQCQLAP